MRCTARACWRIAKSPNTPMIDSNLTPGIDAHGIESGHAGHGFRRIGLSGAKRGPRAGQARLPHPGRGAAAGTGRAFAAARQGRPDPRRAGQSALSGLGRGRDARLPRRDQPGRHSGRGRRADLRCRAGRRAPARWRRRPPPSARGWCMSPRSAPTKTRPRATDAPRPQAKRRCWRRCPRPPSCGHRWCSDPRINSPTVLRRWRGYRRCCR